MKALVFQGIQTGVRLINTSIPTPASGQVLIKVQASPVKPMDLTYAQGTFPANTPSTNVLGSEASGIVVGSGGGLFARSLRNQHVHCFMNSSGSWAEYMVADAANCTILPKNRDFETYAYLTAHGNCQMILEKVKASNAKGVIMTNGYSTVGTMLQRKLKERNIELISIVNSKEHKDTLKDLGHPFVLNSTDLRFERTLERLSNLVPATIAFDNIAGPITNKILRAMPERSQIYLYGMLSLQNFRFDPTELVFRQKQLQGLNFTRWFNEKSATEKFAIGRRAVQDARENGIDIVDSLPLEKFAQARDLCLSNMLNVGKVLLKPNN